MMHGTSASAGETYKPGKVVGTMSTEEHDMWKVIKTYLAQCVQLSCTKGW